MMVFVPQGSGPGVAEANMKDPAYQPSPSSFSISATSVASSEAGSRTGTKAWLTGELGWVWSSLPESAEQSVVDWA